MPSSHPDLKRRTGADPRPTERRPVVERVSAASAPHRPATPAPAPRRANTPSAHPLNTARWVLIGGAAAALSLLLAVLVALVSALGLGRWLA